MIDYEYIYLIKKIFKKKILLFFFYKKKKKKKKSLLKFIINFSNFIIM